MVKLPSKWPKTALSGGDLWWVVVVKGSEGWYMWSPVEGDHVNVQTGPMVIRVPASQSLVSVDGVRQNTNLENGGGVAIPSDFTFSVASSSPQEAMAMMEVLIGGEVWVLLARAIGGTLYTDGLGQSDYLVMGRGWIRQVSVEDITIQCSVSERSVEILAKTLPPYTVHDATDGRFSGWMRHENENEGGIMDAFALSPGDPLPICFGECLAVGVQVDNQPARIALCFDWAGMSEENGKSYAVHGCDGKTLPRMYVDAGEGLVSHEPKHYDMILTRTAGKYLIPRAHESYAWRQVYRWLTLDNVWRGVLAAAYDDLPSDVKETRLVALLFPSHIGWFPSADGTFYSPENATDQDADTHLSYDPGRENGIHRIASMIFEVPRVKIPPTFYIYWAWKHRIEIGPTDNALVKIEHAHGYDQKGTFTTGLWDYDSFPAGLVNNHPSDGAQLDDWPLGARRGKKVWKTQELSEAFHVYFQHWDTKRSNQIFEVALALKAPTLTQPILAQGKWRLLAPNNPLVRTEYRHFWDGWPYAGWDEPTATPAYVIRSLLAFDLGIPPENIDDDSIRATLERCRDMVDFLGGDVSRQPIPLAGQITDKVSARELLDMIAQNGMCLLVCGRDGRYFLKSLTWLEGQATDIPEDWIVMGDDYRASAKVEYRQSGKWRGIKLSWGRDYSGNMGGSLLIDPLGSPSRPYDVQGPGEAQDWHDNVCEGIADWFRDNGVITDSLLSVDMPYISTRDGAVVMAYWLWWWYSRPRRTLQLELVGPGALLEPGDVIALSAPGLGLPAQEGEPWWRVESVETRPAEGGIGVITQITAWEV